MEFLGGSLDATRSIDSRKTMDGKSGGGSCQQAPASVRQLLWRLRRATLRPKWRLLKRVASASTHQGPMESVGGSFHMTRSIGTGKRMDWKNGGRSWRQAPAPVRQLFWRVRRTVLRPKRRDLSFGYNLKSYSQNFDDGLVPAHHL
ncbi:hypothetical protein ZWY2020_006231 [Hordeum vulgare]|nr:hypothetical protein ZWY2020_006231 [Hordeum vulgare]